MLAYCSSSHALEENSIKGNTVQHLYDLFKYECATVFSNSAVKDDHACGILSQ